MADFPSFDLFSEIEDLSSYVDGKCEEKFEFISLDDSMNMNVGIPSHGILDNETVLADVSSNALIGDPLLNYYGQNELLELQSASLSQNPETLMPVSLTADSPPLPPCAPEVGRCSSSPAEESSLFPTPAPLVFPSATPDLEDSFLRATGRHIRVKTESNTKAIPVVGDARNQAAPVRIIVKTKKTTAQPTVRMVAPVTVQRPTQSLVKIPRATSVVQRSSRIQAIRSGGKIGPEASSSNSSNITQASLSSSNITRATLRSRQRSGSSSTSTTSSSEGLQNPTGHPFRSLKSRQISESSEDSLTCLSGKRKAYELDQQEDPAKERCRQNAISAKRNREIKKAKMQELEHQVESISRERDELAGENESLREAKERLEHQVKHLNNILHNQSKLSSLIERLGSTNVVLGDVTTGACEEQIVSSGMCLHVDGDEATIEYCSYCAKKAGKKLNL